MIGRQIKCEQRYRVLEQLGRGRHGQVYLVEKQSLGRKYLLKQIKPELHEDPVKIKSFKDELAVMAAFCHASIPQVHDHFEADDHSFVVMDYIPGQNLTDLLAEQKLPWLESLRIVKQVLAAMAYVHERGYLHCGLHPGLIRIRDDGQVMIREFSTVTPLAQCLGQVPLPQAIQFQAPERLRHGRLTQASDLFSVGVLLFLLVTGELPYKSKHHADLLETMLLNKRPRLSDFAEKPLKGLDHLLDRVLHPSLERRLASCEEFIQMLRIEERALVSEKGGDEGTLKLATQNNGRLLVQDPTAEPADATLLLTDVHSELDPLDKPTEMIPRKDLMQAGPLLNPDATDKTMVMPGDSVDLEKTIRVPPSAPGSQTAHKKTFSWADDAIDLENEGKRTERLHLSSIWERDLSPKYKQKSSSSKDPDKTQKVKKPAAGKMEKDTL